METLPNEQKENVNPATFTSHGKEYPVREGHPADAILAREEKRLEEAEKEYIGWKKGWGKTPEVYKETYREEQERIRLLNFCKAKVALAQAYAELLDDPRFDGVRKKIEDTNPGLKEFFPS